MNIFNNYNINRHQNTSNVLGLITNQEQIITRWVTKNGNTANYIEAKNRILNCIRNQTTNLDLSNLQISVLPPRELFSQLNHLESLNLDKNNIQILGDSLTTLTNLRELILSNNKLTSIRVTNFNNLTNLRTLILSNNEIETIASRSFDMLINLVLLHFGGNHIRNLQIGNMHITYHIDNFQDHLNIWIAGNEINLNYIEARNRILNCIRNQTTNLDLSNLQIRVLPPRELFSQLNHLESLNLDNNNIQMLGDSLTTLTNLRELILSNNKLISIRVTNFNNLTNLRTLILSNNEIETIASRSFDMLINLVLLDFSDNLITNIQPGTFNFQINTQNNNIGIIYHIDNLYNQINTWVIQNGNTPNYIEARNRILNCIITNQITIDLSNLRLTNLPTCFSYLKSIMSINLSKNLLTDSRTISNIFNNLDKLKILDLSKNRLTEINKEMFNNLNTIITLNLDKQRFEFEYENLLEIRINEMSLIDELPEIRLNYYRENNLIAQLRQYFHNRYNHRINQPWHETNMTLDEYVIRFKTRFDYFINNRDSITYDANNNPIAADDYFDLTCYFLDSNPEIITQLRNLEFNAPIVYDGITNLITLEDGIKMSNAQMIYSYFDTAIGE